MHTVASTPCVSRKMFLSRQRFGEIILRLRGHNAFANLRYKRPVNLLATREISAK